MKFIKLPLIVAAALAASAAYSHAQEASATISGASDGSGNYDYTISLFNSGTTPLDGFWYGWTYDGNNLPSDPTAADNSLGWYNYLTGNSIEWQGQGGDDLMPGNSATFTFVAPTDPIDITTDPSGESVVYVYGIDGSQSYPGDSSDPFSPTLAVPEPSSLALLAAGAVVVAASIRQSAAVRQRFILKK